mmetsp:Transcript_50284/g.56178  ORF Transcript_50284/g.56178 Transcript_50284/m.56178 type:complete len:91 (+) Transcript_50284:510-782(+)
MRCCQARGMEKKILFYPTYPLDTSNSICTTGGLWCSEPLIFMFHNLTVLILPRCRFQFLVLKYPNTLTTIRAGVSIELGRHRKLSKGVLL